jgi:hypothetical protein
MVAPNIRGPSASKLLHVTLLAFRNLKLLLRFLENLWTPVCIQLPFLQRYQGYVLLANFHFNFGASSGVISIVYTTVVQHCTVLSICLAIKDLEMKLGSVLGEA